MRRDHVIWIGILLFGIGVMIAAAVIAVLAPDITTRLAMVITAIAVAANVAMVATTPP